MFQTDTHLRISDIVGDKPRTLMLSADAHLRISGITVMQSVKSRHVKHFHRYVKSLKKTV